MQGGGDGLHAELQTLDEATASTSNTAQLNTPHTREGAAAGAPRVLSSGGGINLNLNFFTDDNIPGLSSSEDEDDETESSE